MMGSGLFSEREYRRLNVGSMFPAAPNGAAIADVAPELMPQFREAVARLNGFSSLPEDWDRQGGRALADDAKATAILILNGFGSAGVIPNFVPLNHGGVLFEYESGPTMLDFEVLPSGEVTWTVAAPAWELEGTGSGKNVLAILEAVLPSRQVILPR